MSLGEINPKITGIFSTKSLVSSPSTAGLPKVLVAPSISIGDSSIASFNSYPGVAIGIRATAMGGVCIGNNSTASIGSVTVSPASANSSGIFAVNIGGVSSTGSQSVAIGSIASAMSSTSVAVGYAANASGGSSIAIGSGTQTNSKANSVALGHSTKVDNIGEYAYSSGYMAAQGIGSLKYSVIQLQTTSYNTNGKVMGIVKDSGDSFTDQIILSNNSAYLFNCDVICSKGTGSGGPFNGIQGQHIQFIISRGGSASTTMVQGVVSTTIAPGNSVGAVSVAADTTNGGPAFTFTGSNGSITATALVTCHITKLSPGI